MANTAHLVRRQSSRDLNPQRSIDRLELKEMKGRLVVENGTKGPGKSTGGTSGTSYGATNAGFEDSSPSKSATIAPPSTLATIPSANSSRRTSQDGGKAVFKPDCQEEERESWDSKLTFILATVGYAVGLGNVWRFPYLAQKNGGGAFLIPYFIMLAIEGIPIFYLELAVGQRLRKGAIGAWTQVSPYLSGIGISSVIVAFNVALYYNTIIAWCLFYFLQSFQAQLPWAECPKVFFPNKTYIEEPECVASSPTQYFWYRSTLMVSPDINSPEVFNWKIAVLLIIAWAIVYMCMIKGITSSPKVVYITATFPYIVLVTFFFRGITLKGASDGILHLFTPRWHTLSDPVVWLEAGTQIFFSLGLAFGGLIAFSSYNPVNNNCYRDAIFVSLTNCFTSMFAGIVVFSIIGFKATMTYERCLDDRNHTIADAIGTHQFNFSALPAAGATFTVNTPHGIKEVVMPKLPECSLQKELDNTASGTGLAFIIFTEAINQFPAAQFWAVLFFLMLFTLGIDSQFGMLEGVISSLVDMKLFPNAGKEVITGGLCMVCAVLSLVFAQGAGSYIFVLFDNFAGNFPLLIIAFFECMAVAYIYGLKRFADDIEMMTGSRPGLYWMFCWKYLSPLAMLTILAASFIEIATKGSGYDAWVPSLGTTERHSWPTWAIVLILLLIFMSVIWIPVTAILRFAGVVLIGEEEKSWFPANDLKEFHGIMPHEPTPAEQLLFCIRPDGSEGLCCPTYHSYDLDEDD